MPETNIMKKILFGLTLILLAGCGKENKKSDSNEFVLDFNSQKKFIYTYSQTSTSETQWKKNEAFQKTKSDANGQLNIRIKENNLADLSVTNLKTNLITLDDKGVAVDTMSNTTQAMVIQNMNQKGGFENYDHNIMFDLIFPLPTKNLKIGETDKIPMQIPFNVNGSKLYIKGFNEIKYSGTKVLNGTECAVLNGTIDISELEIPEELESLYESKTTGNGTYYFNLKDKYFVGADINIIMATSSSPKTENSENNLVFGTMKNSTEITIRLKEIEK